MNENFSKTHWGYYKESKRGIEVIGMFRKLFTNETTVDSYLVAKRFNSTFFGNGSINEEEDFRDWFKYCDDVVSYILFEYGGKNKVEDYEDFYRHLTYKLGVPDEDVALIEAPQIGFKKILSYNLPITFALYRYLPEYFIPNVFVCQFVYMKKLFQKYEIEMSEVPIRSDYRGRWLYYLEICNKINDFAKENGLTDRAELCAFLFDYELTDIKEKSLMEYEKPIPVVPENAWILVGNRGEGEINMDLGIWQANSFTRKGDVMVFYEKSPMKKMNAIWRALEDGVIDPFFHYYSYTKIGQRIVIPDELAITFEDFKNSEYFKVENRGREGNFVSKNFQDCSGWAVTSSDYKEIKRMLEAKGFDTSVLPSLYEPKKLTGIDILLEKDVSWKLLVPLLEEMGWKYKEDFFDEVEFPAGHSTTGHKMEKRPDFCLHMSGSGSQLTTKVVIEVKYWMKNNDEIKKTFDQGVTYAKWGEAKVLVLCDKNQIRVYERNKKGLFNKDKRVFFRWEDMEELERFIELKRLLDI